MLLEINMFIICHPIRNCCNALPSFHMASPFEEQDIEHCNDFLLFSIETVSVDPILAFVRVSVIVSIAVDTVVLIDNDRVRDETNTLHLILVVVHL